MIVSIQSQITALGFAINNISRLRRLVGLPETQIELLEKQLKAARETLYKVEQGEMK
jgi:hypothetical protein